MAQEFNSDPQGWELTDKFGDRSLRIWIEVLAIIDRENNQWKRVDGWDSVIARKVRQSPATVRSVVGWMLANGWLEVGQPSASGQPEVLRARNYPKYHKTRAEVSPPPNLTEPSEPKSLKKDSPPTDLFKPEMSVQDFVDSWNANFRGRLPVVEWPLSTSRHRKAAIRLKEHKSIAFWTQVFTNIGASSFLLGVNNGNWRCTFDFLINNDSNCIKIYEGAYSRQR